MNGLSVEGDGAKEDFQFEDATTLLDNGFDFNLDYLEDKGKKEITSTLRKQSLYLRFDPLVSSESPAKPVLGRKSDIIDFGSGVCLTRQAPPTRTAMTSQRVQPDFLCDSPSAFKISSEEKATGNAKSEEKDEAVSHQSPATDAIVEVLKYSDDDLQKSVDEVRLPLEAKISSLQKQINGQHAKMKMLTETLEQLEHVSFHLKHEKEESEKLFTQEKGALVIERDGLRVHLSNCEKAHLELLQRAELVKECMDSYKHNELTYKRLIDEYKAAHVTSQDRYNALKLTMEEKLKEAAKEKEQTDQENKSQLSTMKAKLKMMESQMKSLQSSLEQKTVENKELSSICDELLHQSR